MPAAAGSTALNRRRPAPGVADALRATLRRPCSFTCRQRRAPTRQQRGTHAKPEIQTKVLVTPNKAHTQCESTSSGRKAQTFGKTSMGRIRPSRTARKNLAGRRPDLSSASSGASKPSGGTSRRVTARRPARAKNWNLSATWCDAPPSHRGGGPFAALRPSHGRPWPPWGVGRAAARRGLLAEEYHRCSGCSTS